MTESDGGGKRVSWVELYFDLVFVFAVSQEAHAIVAHPTWGGVGAALGLFATLWWTWIGFVLLYNRHGEDRGTHRLFLLAGTVPCAIAAVQTHDAALGHTAGFALALAGARLVLAVAFPLSAGQGRVVGRRVGFGYAVSTVAFAVSAVVPAPWRYVVWGLTLLQEAGFLLLSDARSRSGARRAVARGTTALRRGEVVRRDRAEAARLMMEPPADPRLAVDAAHLAERFGLFMIILLGEIVVSVGAAALDLPHHGLPYWLGLLAGLVLAAALWWIYFDSAAHINEYVLRASGGNPTLAYGIYAGGHLMPAFALVVVAAGMNLSLHPEPPRAAVWLVTGGLAGYLVGTRAFAGANGSHVLRLLRMLALAATVNLALLRLVLITPAVVAVVAVWAAVVAAVVSWQRPGLLRRLATDPFAIFRNRS